MKRLSSLFPTALAVATGILFASCYNWAMENKTSSTPAPTESGSAAKIVSLDPAFD